MVVIQICKRSLIEFQRSFVDVLVPLLATCLTEENLKGLTFKVTDIFMWTDSTTDLQWPNFFNKLPFFVGNHSGEIRECTTTDQWPHILSGDIFQLISVH